MNAEHLVGMANRIALFFAAMPEHGEALEGVATHLKKFWEPRMRSQLLQVAGGADGEYLHPLVREAIATGAVQA